MRILIVHNAYRLRGGEDAVVDSEVALLRRRGHEVIVLRGSNVEMPAAPRAALSAMWSRHAYQAVTDLCRDKRPQVVHVHNTLARLSPSVYWAASAAGVPVIQTLHNFRLMCVQATFYREGAICEDCVGKSPWRGVVRKCYRDSVAQSGVVAGQLMLHRMLGTYSRKITRYVALNTFCRDRFINAGFPANKFVIKPNCFDTTFEPRYEGRAAGLYVGRLSPEKGIGCLVDAAGLLGPEFALQVVGGGPMESQVRQAFGPRWLGELPFEQTIERLRGACYLVVPSTCYESAPRAVVEAFACGVPVIASRLGALADMVTDRVTGLLVEPDDRDDLARALAWADSHPDEMLAMGRRARQVYEQSYAPDGNIKQLESIYRAAIRDVNGAEAARSSPPTDRLRDSQIFPDTRGF